MTGLYPILAAIIAFGVTAVSGKWAVPYLKKLKYGQTILDEGPSWHKKKEGTPTMGGIIFIIGIVLAVIVGIAGYFTVGFDTEIQNAESNLAMMKIIAGMLMALAYGGIGFFDDYIKVVKKRNLGLTALQKLFLQILVAVAYLATISLTFSMSTEAGSATITNIPFLGQVDLGWGYFIISVILIVGFVNAVNLTDGIDGLCGTVAFFCAVAFMIIGSVVGKFGISILSAAIAGGALGFLIWNFYPAKVFMGDTGSLFLGGCMCAMAFGLDMPILLVPVCFVYLIETLSVMMQVTYFKLTKGKRLFKMSPIHHHFEMCGWSEIKIVTVSGIVSGIAGIITIMLVIFGGIK